MTCIMLVADQTFKAALRLATDAGRGEDICCGATGAAQQWLVRQTPRRGPSAKDWCLVGRLN